MLSFPSRSVLSAVFIAAHLAVGRLPAEAGDTPIIRDPTVGVCTHFAFGGPDWSPATVVPLLANLNVGWIRDELYWARLEKQPGVYVMSAESLAWINAVHAAGIKIDLIFDNSNPIYPNKYDPHAYTRAAAWVAGQLKGKIDAIEILNEPENFGFSVQYDHEQAWSGLRSDGTVATYVGKYVELLNLAAKAVRAANPDLKIIGLGCSPGANFHALAMGIDPHVDGITDHPYSPHSMPELVPFAGTPSTLKRDGVYTADAKGTFVSQVRMYRARSAQFNGPRELWQTEEGWPTYRPLNPFTFYAGVSQDGQARYLLRRLTEARGLGVDHSFIYDFRDDGTSPGDNVDHYGLIDFHNVPKLSYAAVQRFCAAMAGAAPAPAITTRVSLDAPPPASFFGGSDLAGADALRSYSFHNVHGDVLLALWDAQPATDNFSPVSVTVEIAGAPVPTGITAFDPLTGKTWPVPFTTQPTGLALKGFPLSNSPVLLTFLTAK
jgi:hypothetical protein